MDLGDIDDVEKLLLGPSGFSSLSLGCTNEEEGTTALVDRLKEENANKGTPSKSVVMFDVKPADGDTNLSTMEETVRRVNGGTGLVWGPSKRIPIAFGIHKLRIVSIVDDSVPVEELIEHIQSTHEDLIQSVDIVAFCAL
ncbi:unnamed protein product, partial [Mesorhabditis belari]|uniref:Translation elongation factor EF1B beta/delta subunit guanine nucleotide exchange domain-containing protein n=1 Tax=Mesorhabditis belari TaxID=2138241 RepID=A0AAF3ERD3_9BILA